MVDANNVLVEVKPLSSVEDSLLNEIMNLCSSCDDVPTRKAEIKTLLHDGSIHILVAKEAKGIADRVLGFVLFYSHYSTWMGESTVIKHIATLKQDTGVAKQLIQETFNVCNEKGIRRYDVFTTEEWLKQVLAEMQFVNLSVEEDWDCYTLEIQ